jgi:hypothetical protein
MLAEIAIGQGQQPSLVYFTSIVAPFEQSLAQTHERVTLCDNVWLLHGVPCSKSTVYPGLVLDP